MFVKPVRRASCARGSKFGQHCGSSSEPSRAAREGLSNLLSARSLPSHSIEDAARDGPCAHGNARG